MNRDKPTVDRAIRVPDVLRLACSKLEDQEKPSVATEHLGALVLVRVPSEVELEAVSGLSGFSIPGEDSRGRGTRGL
jgi:hypothetical protein